MRRLFSVSARTGFPFRFEAVASGSTRFGSVDAAGLSGLGSPERGAFAVSNGFSTGSGFAMSSGFSTGSGFATGSDFSQ